MVLGESRVDLKIKNIEQACHRALLGCGEALPAEPARDISVRHFRQIPPRPGLGSTAGQIRLLHDLANIELQAMELGLRTLLEFPEAPRALREELAAITLEEASHLELCLRAIESLGGQWGDWPAHLGLWSAISTTDNLLERIFIVHRYLESSGLDAGEGLLRRLSGLADKNLQKVVKIIVRDEVGHVEFGSRWYFELCREFKVDAFDFFTQATSILMKTNPRREPLAEELRVQAGYSPRELKFMRELQASGSRR